MRKSISLTIAFSVLAVAVWCVSAAKAEARGAGNPRPQPVIYVESQGLYYDSIVTADPLPPFGNFQVLWEGANGLTTDFGPGDAGYLGGRWVKDGNHFFSCPLMGPGRENP
jgi:hypothetical protein